MLAFIYDLKRIIANCKQNSCK